MLGYLLSTDGVLLFAATVIVDSVILYKVVDPVPRLRHSHHHTTVLSLSNTPHCLRDLTYTHTVNAY